MKVRMRVIRRTLPQQDYFAEGEIDVPDGAVNVQTTTLAGADHALLCVTWLELTPQERFALQQQLGARQGLIS